MIRSKSVVVARTSVSLTSRKRFFYLFLLFCVVIAISAWAVTLGTKHISLVTIWDAIFWFDGSREHLLVMSIRLPRVLAGLLVGSALAVSGAIMQSVTGNPLASPGLLGVNAGAALAVVAGMSLFGTSLGSTSVWLAFGGAAIASAIVLLLGLIGRQGATPLKLVLVGAVVSTFLMSLTTAVLIFDETTLDAVRLWTIGSLSGRTMEQVRLVAPYIVLGLIASLPLRQHLMSLSLGTEVSQSLGQNPVFWRGISMGIVVFLAGGAVSLAGPVGFLGLVVPHIVRMIIGVDYRWIIPFSALGGALLLVFADMAGRVLFASQNFPAGVTMAIIGAPFFLWLARYRLRAGA
ncbi:iron ABC transporter permease [Phyllobacterium sp. YR531]|uniref:FecCD family ABC transporter permease n=1 Tax=Phyllobacterium sp. YR531 TaxID=1144343 RepID=UPI00026F6CE0|nr:iron ABC transporter permease [Phyllobacterium sp. YR531]EJN02558.1 ABC-type Fe3+-siderophore transport system, permease component [Phyllobacterium sp. YR531]